MSEYTKDEIKELCDWLSLNSSGYYRQCDEAAVLIEHQHGRIKGLELDLGLARLSIENGQRLLTSCETALSARDDRIFNLSDKLNMVIDLLDIPGRAFALNKLMEMDADKP